MTFIPKPGLVWVLIEKGKNKIDCVRVGKVSESKPDQNDG